MDELGNISQWKLAAAVLAVIGGAVYLLYRTGQLALLLRQGSRSRIRFQREQSAFEGILCPDFDSREIKVATKSYVKPDCAQIDPANEQQMHGFASVREQAFKALDRYIGDDAKKHIIVLADSGMGKTTLCLNYYHTFSNVTLSAALISLSRPDAEEKIARIPNKRSTVLMLDAFDEDAKAMTSGTARLFEFLELCTEFTTVIVTCRSQFFENDAAIPTHTGIARITPSSGEEGPYYDLSRVYLLPFDAPQISAYLRRKFPYFSFFGWFYRRRAKDLIRRIPELSVRPMLLALVPDLVREDRDPSEIFELYEYMIDKWLERESRWVDKSTLYRVSTDLALLLSFRRQTHDTDRIFPEDLHSQAEMDFSGIDWGHLTTRSLLNRDSEGRLKFAHRTVMEYLVVKAVLNGNQGAVGIPWTDFMKELLVSFTQISPGKMNAARAAVAALFQNKTVDELSLPRGELLPLPSERSVDEFKALAGQPPRGLMSRRELPTEIRDLTVLVHKDVGHVFLHDYEYDLSWRVPDLSSREVSQDYELYRSSLADITHRRFAEDYDLPSFAEFISLLRLQEAFPQIDLIRDFDFYWLGDSTATAKHTVVSVNRDLKAEGVIDILSRTPVAETSKTINLYAIDAYRQRNTLKNLRALELRVKRGTLRRRHLLERRRP